MFAKKAKKYLFNVHDILHDTYKPTCNEIMGQPNPGSEITGQPNRGSEIT